MGLLLDDGRAIPKRPRAHQVSDPYFYQIAAAQFAIDGEIEQGPVTQMFMFVEVEADRLDIARL